MRLIIQRVNSASVAVDGSVIGSINRGYLVLLGVSNEDTKETVKVYADKMIKMRIFEDEAGKTNLSLADVSGEVLVVSQFTLYADCRKGNRPSFINAGAPQMAKELYEYFVEYVKMSIPVVQTGEFGADMKVSLENDGPFTIILDESLIGK